MYLRSSYSSHECSSCYCSSKSSNNWGLFLETAPPPTPPSSAYRRQHINTACHSSLKTVVSCNRFNLSIWVLKMVAVLLTLLLIDGLIFLVLLTRTHPMIKWLMIKIKLIGPTRCSSRAWPCNGQFNSTQSRTFSSLSLWQSNDSNFTREFEAMYIYCCTMYGRMVSRVWNFFYYSYWIWIIQYYSRLT